MNRPIKILKLAERERRAEAETHPPGAGEEDGAQGRPGAVNRSNAREATATINGWIGDLRSEQRRTRESTTLNLSEAGLVYKPQTGRKQRAG